MRLPIVEAYELWAESYDSCCNPILALETRTMAALLTDLTPANVVEVACGTGRWLAWFHARGVSAFGLDVSNAMLRQSQKRSALQGRVMQADAEALPFADGCADLVLCSMSLAYLAPLQTVFREFARVARQGASVAVSDLHPDAIAAGWTRSFRSGQVSYEVENFAYTIEAISEAAANVRLASSKQVAAYLGAPEFSIFQQAGKATLYAATLGTPAVFAGVWKKL